MERFPRSYMCIRYKLVNDRNALVRLMTVFSANAIGRMGIPTSLAVAEEGKK